MVAQNFPGARPHTHQKKKKKQLVLRTRRPEKEKKVPESPTEWPPGRSDRPETTGVWSQVVFLQRNLYTGFDDARSRKGKNEESRVDAKSRWQKAFFLKKNESVIQAQSRPALKSLKGQRKTASLLPTVTGKMNYGLYSPSEGARLLPALTARPHKQFAAKGGI